MLAQPASRRQTAILLCRALAVNLAENTHALEKLEKEFYTEARRAERKNPKEPDYLRALRDTVKRDEQAVELCESLKASFPVPPSRATFLPTTRENPFRGGIVPAGTRVAEENPFDPADWAVFPQEPPRECPPGSACSLRPLVQRRRVVFV
ncbi:MAG: hypothetical protein KGJ23_08400 [Euryarchaeota archaeon]|nr:hypothetical protein [Euryarchaeota archaeon]MDE1836623.1 hypothetical protein [Euryarchaeota archaeon]MDE1879182.1 hypothetical protein [Euryarchaeota archaeon]MDE2044593.1 hypothetical protein [Thermoplasmata archaeon]